MPCLTCDYKSVSVFNKRGVNISHFFTCELLGNYLGNFTCLSSRYLKFNVCEIEFTFLFPHFSFCLDDALSVFSLSLPLFFLFIYKSYMLFLQNMFRILPLFPPSIVAILIQATIISCQPFMVIPNWFIWSYSVSLPSGL